MSPALPGRPPPAAVPETPGARLHQEINELTWDLGHLSGATPESALVLHVAAHRLAACADAVLCRSVGEHGEPPPGAPLELSSLLAALVAFGRAGALDRGRTAPALIDLAKAVLAAERGRAMIRTGLPVEALAREYGISRGAVRAAMRNAHPD